MSTENPIAHACRLLREAADEIQQGHTLSSNRADWTGEPEAKAAFDEHHAAADALEALAASLGAGGASPWTGAAGDAGSEPVAIYHGRCVIDCGAHGHLDMELLKMIPAGTNLYTHPSPPEGMVGGWMPIETAPKDGRTVLVFPATWDDRSCSTAKYDPDKYAKKPKPYWYRDDAFGKVGICRVRPPTHWRELPPAPSSDKGVAHG